MNGFGRLTGSRSSRLLWAAASAVLLLAIVGTFVLSGSAVTNSRASAQSKAVTYANTVVADKLSATQIQRGIPKDDYAALLVAVQGKILTDQTVDRVRLWAPDGTLLFSTDRADSVGDFRATVNAKLAQAIAGQTGSVLTGQMVPGKQGLAGSSEQQYVSYVPLRLTAQQDVTAVIEIDHDAGALQAATTHVLKLLQYLLVAVLVPSLVFLVLSLRTAPRHRTRPSSRSVDGPSDHEAERLRRAQSALRDAEERASGAERGMASLKGHLEELETSLAEFELRATASEAETADAQRKAKEAEERLAEAVAANRALGGTASSAKVAELEAELTRYRSEAARATELEAEVARLRGELASTREEGASSTDDMAELISRLRQSEAERERSGAEAQRLKAALAEREAALALAREHLAEAAATDPAAADQLVGLQARAHEAESESARLREELDHRALRQREVETDLEVTTAKLETLEADLQGVRQELAERASRSEAGREEIERALADAHEGTRRAEQRIRELEDLVRAGEERSARSQERAAQAEERATKAEERATVVTAQVEEIRARAAVTEERAGQAEAMATQLGQARAQLQTASTELDGTRTELENTRAELLVARAELEAVARPAEQAPEVSGPSVPLEAVAELQARIAELEGLRREEVSELQRTQQAQANTQYEMTEMARRAKQADERLRELEGESPIPRQLKEWPPGSADTELDSDEALASALETIAPAEWVADTSASDVEGSEDVQAPDDVPENHVMPSKEGLSLRERLTRAAAARHRISSPVEEEEAGR
ncbi:MAG TPA: hypothetical protein VF984_01080 [Actinomycetota bacterium]